MAKVVLGKTPQELEAERAKQARELEAEIQKSIIERQKKIQSLHNKQKSNKVIIILISILIAAVFVVFGTYNTFFKKGLTMDEVNNSIATYTQQSKFPSEGLDNYVRDNCETLFNKYVSLDDNSAKNTASVDVDKNSCYILKVRKLNATLAEVYFSVDISVTEKDTIVTDPVIIDQLKRNGFGVIPKAEAPEVVDTTESAPVEEPVAEPVAEPPVEESIPTTDIDFAASTSEEAAHYYMTASGQIMKSGTTSTMRYSFVLPLEFKYYYDTDGTVMYAGYVATSDMNLYSLQEKNQVDFEEITVAPVYAFKEETRVDENTLHDIQIRVDKTLDALYAYENTEAEYKLYQEFNTYGASYNGITAIDSYTEANELGYNTHVTYTITTSQGFSYTLETYMLLEPDGNSWIIKKIM